MVFPTLNMADQLGKIRRHQWKERFRMNKLAKKLSNLALILISRRSFQQSRRISPNLSIQKVEKKPVERPIGSSFTFHLGRVVQSWVKITQG